MKTRVCLCWLLTAGCAGQEADPFAGQAGDSSGDVDPSTTGGPESGRPDTDTDPGGDDDDDDDDAGDDDDDPVKLDVGMPDLLADRLEGDAALEVLADCSTCSERPELEGGDLAARDSRT